MNFKFRMISLILALIITMTAYSSCNESEKETDKDTSAEAQSEIESPDTLGNIDFKDIEPAIVNPLTGLGSDVDTNGKRPAAIMLNNIYEALPQVGIGKADILFECLAEGGITRLMGLFSDYGNLGVIGSVRSARPYYIDFAQMFDAIYCHAGGSEDAYSDMVIRGIDHVDGVRGDPLNVYYRDETRLQTMAMEHTLMTTGTGLLQTIDYCAFRKDLREGFDYPFVFADYSKPCDIGGNKCVSVHLPISTYQTVDYKYDSDIREYLRFQYDGMPHIDGETGEQLSFKNLIIIFCNTYAYDSYGRLTVETAGYGSGYLVSEGKYAEITWSRESIDGNISFMNSSGEKITLNRGKTMINVCPLETAYEVVFGAE